LKKWRGNPCGRAGEGRGGPGQTEGRREGNLGGGGFTSRQGQLKKEKKKKKTHRLQVFRGRGVGSYGSRGEVLRKKAGGWPKKKSKATLTESGQLGKEEKISDDPINVLE